ncbi:hypothetical protein FPV67DRAFT_1456626 [Lyophyllum atratum]|nr:hypothetical protein FPV67DRAFT_1456626 [Lyophyllum atratum]
MTAAADHPTGTTFAERFPLPEAVEGAPLRGAVGASLCGTGKEEYRTKLPSSQRQPPSRPKVMKCTYYSPKPRLADRQGLPLLEVPIADRLTAGTPVHIRVGSRVRYGVFIRYEWRKASAVGEYRRRLQAKGFTKMPKTLAPEGWVLQGRPHQLGLKKLQQGIGRRAVYKCIYCDSYNKRNAFYGDFCTGNSEAMCRLTGIVEPHCGEPFMIFPVRSDAGISGDPRSPSLALDDEVEDKRADLNSSELNVYVGIHDPPLLALYDEFNDQRAESGGPRFNSRLIMKSKERGNCGSPHIRSGVEYAVM